MELRQLRHFIAVAECGTFSKASTLLNLTQPALTRSVQTLEDIVGTSLFTREARGVTLTEAGSRLLRHAKLMDAQSAAAREEIDALSNGRTGRLSIGMAPMFAASVMDQLLIELGDTLPDVRFDVHSALFSELLEGLEVGDIDVALSTLPLQAAPRGIATVPLFESHTQIYASADHPLATDSSVNWSQLGKEKWALMKQNIGNDVISALAHHGANFSDTEVRTNSLTLLRTLVLSGCYLTLLPDHWLAADISAGRLVALNAPGLPLKRTAGVLTRENTSREAAVTAFLNAARQFAQAWQT